MRYLKRKDGKRDKRSRTTTERLEASLRIRDRIIRSRDLYLLWAIVESGAEAHLEPLLEKNDYWKAVLCVHSKAGQLTFKLSDIDMAFFGHLPQAATSHWEGHSADVNAERIQRLISGEAPMREPVNAQTRRIQKLKRHGTASRHAIYVATKALGKPLPDGAVVHHVNGEPTDNRPENLVICQDRDYHMLLHENTKLRAERLERESD